MRRSKFIVVARFEIPSESVLLGRPKHEVRGDFDTGGIRFPAVFVRVNPLRADSKHELEFRRNGPRLLEEKIGAPFR